MVHDDLIMMKQDSYLSAVDKTWLQTEFDPIPSTGQKTDTEKPAV